MVRYPLLKQVEPDAWLAWRPGGAVPGGGGRLGVSATHHTPCAESVRRSLLFSGGLRRSPPDGTNQLAAVQSRGKRLTAGVSSLSGGLLPHGSCRCAVGRSAVLFP